jgi:putative tryptophan/tyrosine transport system substrate-binding protein
MKRRDFIKLLGGAAALPIAARAQQGERMRRIGILTGRLSSGDAPELGAFLQGMRELGWSEGRNLRIEYRWPGDDANKTEADAAELVKLNLDLLAGSTAPAVAALARFTKSIPIVQMSGGDMVALGLAASVAKPGGNVTGVQAQEPATSGKWLETLNEIAPGVSRVLVLQNSGNPNRNLYYPYIEAAAQDRGIRAMMPDFSSDAEMDSLLGAFASTPNGGLVVIPGPFANVHHEMIIAQAARYRIPAVYPFPSYVEAGGLVSYGIDSFDVFRRSATYVDRILKGAKPADLPIQLPEKFVLTINLRTAKALGLDVPPLMLARADEVIE